LRFDAIHAHNNPVVKTPNIDRLVRMGVSFQRAYTPPPVCVAARCAMITGCYPTKTGCVSNDRMPEDIPSFMELLSENGYRTHGIGKCHFTPDSYALRGFQVRERKEEGSPKSLEGEPYYEFLVENGFDYTYETNGVRGPMYYIPQPARMPSHMHHTHWVGDRSVYFIEARADEAETKPWYLFSSFLHPHPPFTPPVPWHKLYDPVQMPLPLETADDESLQMFVNKVQNRYKYKDQGYDLNLIRCMKAYYYACVSFVDYQVGRILEALEKSGQMDNTMIVFTSDHGELLGDYHCYGKRSMHDAPARIPLVVYQKDMFEGGRKVERPVSLLDLAPTFLEAAEVSETSYEHIDGVSLQSLDQGDAEREYVYSMYSCYQEANWGCMKKLPELYKKDKELFKAIAGCYMITDGKWKYIYSAPDQKEFLFDLECDKETRNRFGVVGCREPQQRLKKQLMQFLEKDGLTCLFKDDEWLDYPKLELPDNPDAGLLIQDITCGWYDEMLPGYRE